MWVTSHSSGVSPAPPQGHALPSCTVCPHLFLAHEVFPQPTAALLNLAQPKLFAMLGGPSIPTVPLFQALVLEQFASESCSRTLLPALW